MAFVIQKFMPSPSSNNKEISPIYLLFVFFIFVGLMVYTFLGDISKAVESFDKICESPFFSPICKIGGGVEMFQTCLTTPGACKIDLFMQEITDSIESFKIASVQMGASIQNYMLNNCDEANKTFINSAESAFSFVFGHSILTNNMWDTYKESFEDLYSIACDKNKNITSFESGLYIVAAVLSFLFFFLSVFLTVFMRWYPAVFSLIFSYLSSAAAYSAASGTFVFDKFIEGLGMFLPMFFIGLYIIFTILFIQTLWFLIYICYIKFGQGAKISLPRFADFSGKSYSIPIEIIVVVLAAIITLLFLGTTITQNIATASWSVLLLSIIFYISYRFLRSGDGSFFLPTFPSLIMNNIIPFVLAVISLRSESLRAYFAQAGFLDSTKISAAFAQVSYPQVSAGSLFPSTPAAIFDPALWGEGLFISIIFSFLFIFVMIVVNKQIFLRIIKGESVHLWTGALHQGINEIRTLTTKIEANINENMQLNQQILQLEQQYADKMIKYKNSQDEEERAKLEQELDKIIMERLYLYKKLVRLDNFKDAMELKMRLEQIKLDDEQTKKIKQLDPNQKTKK
ncbi:MAG: hypothetical protein CO072_01500 [Candidatus Huberarchaeum crystalense]|uniref:Uncharacterized protein n=5 Tax=Huberarchaeum crystalense TaxID=2014257 RepID=A0A2H9RDL3_HUBC1|nr:MAG: hypothetical protein CO072_01500 [Candidatus Huberarchaeum crystalense]